MVVAAAKYWGIAIFSPRSMGSPACRNRFPIWRGRRSCLLMDWFSTSRNGVSEACRSLQFEALPVVLILSLTVIPSLRSAAQTTPSASASAAVLRDPHSAEAGRESGATNSSAPKTVPASARRSRDITGGSQTVRGHASRNRSLPPNGYRLDDFVEGSLSIDNAGTLHFMWEDFRNGGTCTPATLTPPSNNEVFYSFSTDHGAT